MGTSRLLLAVPGGCAPDGSGSGNNAATPEKRVSTGTQTTNTPKVAAGRLAFDQSTDEHWLWQFPCPADYSSGGTLKLTWGANTTTGNVVWKVAAIVAEPGSTSLDTGVFSSADLSSATAVPGTVGLVTETSITLTNSFSGLDVTGGSDMVVIMVGRDADNGSDTAAADAYLYGLCVEYTT